LVTADGACSAAKFICEGAAILEGLMVIAFSFK